MYIWPEQKRRKRLIDDVLFKVRLNNSITHPGLIKAVEGFIFNRLFLFSREWGLMKSHSVFTIISLRISYIFSVTNIMNLDGILFLKNLVDDPESFCYEGAIPGKLFFQSLPSEGIIF